jgi:hypothetical protein
MAQPELKLHIQVADFLKLALDRNVAWSTIAHGGFKLPKRTAEKLKAMGLRGGFPDIMLVHPTRGVFCGIELKSASGRLSEDQVAIHGLIRKSWGLVEVCRSVEEVEGTLRAWGFELRATTSARAA